MPRDYNGDPFRQPRLANRAFDANGRLPKSLAFSPLGLISNRLMQD